MRMIQSSFPRIADTLVFENTGDRRVVMRLMIHLYNFQCAQVGINQILNSFMTTDSGYFDNDFISRDANYIID